MNSLYAVIYICIGGKYISEMSQKWNRRSIFLQENIKNGFLSHQHDIINHGEKLRDTPKTMIKHLMVRECL